MPLSELQSAILRVIAANRDPESFVAGGVPINRFGPRVSADIDIFHDRAERVGAAALADASALVGAGFTVTWTRQQPAIYGAVIVSGTESTRLEWVADSDFRFFPAVPDDQFGFVLHPVDLAVNKVSAAASRREPRDIVDLITLHERVLPLGALVWAATEVAPGFTPEGLVAEIRRNARYPAAELRQLASSSPIDPVVVMAKLKSQLDEAEAFISRMPSDKIGLIFLQDGRPVQPDPAQLPRYMPHAATRRGHWPSSPDITNAMLERLKLQGV